MHDRPHQLGPPKGTTRRYRGYLSVPVLQHVEDLGQLAEDEVSDWMGRASIVALPTPDSPYSLSALEAGLAECTLVLGDTPSLREVREDAAVYVPPSDGEALRKTLRQLISDEARRTELACRARERARRYPPNRTAARYATSFARMMRHRRALPK